jgi:hypothetical protein
MNKQYAKLYTNFIVDFKFPTNRSRKNILREGQDKYEGFVLGLVNYRGSKRRDTGLDFGECRRFKMDKYKELFAMTKYLIDPYLEKHDRFFKYTSIQFNKNHQCAYHKDGNNVGDSYIIGLGDYTGGELIIYDKDGKNPIKNDIKNKFVKFNGSIYPHETAPFKGNRITLVFYNILHNPKNTMTRDVPIVKN